MPFNVEQHANLGYIDRPIKELLDRLCDAHGRTLKKELEFLIVDAAKNNELNPKP
jgi:hypothetical protein